MVALPVVSWFHVGTVPVNPVYATLVAVAAFPLIEPTIVELNVFSPSIV